MDKFSFDALVSQIQTTNEALQNNARLVINRHVTAKAWLTGYCIVVYEQNGSDRAKYGEQLLQNLVKRLGNKYALSTLKLYRLFYLTYPQLSSVVGDFLIHLPIGQSVISQLRLPSGKSQSQTDQSLLNGQSQIAQFPTTTHSSSGQFNGVNPEMLFNRLSFTHFDEDVFVSRYILSIPSKERMTEFLRKENEGLTRKEDEV